MTKLATLGATVRVIAALLGTMPVAFLASLALARQLPLALESRFSLGLLLFFPLWVTALCWVWLSRSWLRAWLWCFCAALPCAAMAVL